MIRQNSLVSITFPGLLTIQFLWSQKPRGNVWFILSHEGRQCLQQGRGVPDQKNAFCACILCFQQGAVCFWLCKHSKFQRLGQKLPDKASTHSFDRGPLPSLCLYLGITDVIRMTKWIRPFPSVFAYCKQPKIGRWEGLTNSCKIFMVLNFHGSFHLWTVDSYNMDERLKCS